MATSIPHSLTLRPSGKKSAVLFLASLMFVVLGVFASRIDPVIGYLGIGFFGLGLPFFALQFHPKAAYLQIAPEGFTVCSLFRPHLTRWSDVAEFGVITIGHQHQTVAWNYTPNYQAKSGGRAMSKAISGYEAGLPDTYGTKAHELADLMESLRQRFVEGQSFES